MRGTVFNGRIWQLLIVRKRFELNSCGGCPSIPTRLVIAYDGQYSVLNEDPTPFRTNWVLLY